jgi:hypothetical protein
VTEQTNAALRNVALKERHPRIDDPIEAIKFALALGADCFDFLQTWNEGAWNEIEQAYPEFLEAIKC